MAFASLLYSHLFREMLAFERETDKKLKSQEKRKIFKNNLLFLSRNGTIRSGNMPFV